MNIQNLNLVDKVIELAKKFGDVDTEVVISNISDTTVEARNGNIEFSNVSDNSSISLRVIDNNDDINDAKNPDLMPSLDRDDG